MVPQFSDPPQRPREAFPDGIGFAPPTGVQPPPTVLPSLKLTGLRTQHLRSSVKLSVAANRVGASRVVATARVGKRTLTAHRSLYISKLTPAGFRLAFSASQNRVLREALKQHSVKVTVRVEGLNTETSRTVTLTR